MQTGTSHSQALPLLESSNANMTRAIAVARQVARSNAAVLITGESGTGKRALARAIHDWSLRRDRAFVITRPVRAGRRPDGELLTDFEQIRKDECRWFEAANGGTLFFEEVGDLPAAQQSTLIGVLDGCRFERSNGEAGEVDMRVIAATHYDIDADVRAGRFREDLYFRLSTVSIRLPPLRDRREDLPRLTDYLLAGLAARYHRDFLQVAPEVAELFARYPWPGNVRELEGILERAVVLSPTDTITADVLPDRVSSPDRPPVSDAPSSPVSLRDFERLQIEMAIKESATLKEAALRLRIDLATLWRKRKRYHLA